MLLNWIYLKDFRNYANALVEFSPTINGIVGANAQGKTNLLEAIYFLITGRSFRTSQLSDLIKDGATHFYIEAGFTKENFEQTIRITCDGKQRNIIYNNTRLTNTSQLLGILQGVILSPEDKEIVKGAPQVRRRFIDIHLAQSDPLYVYKLSRYNRAMKHRNQLLRLHKLEGIESWEQEMSNAAAYIVQRRRQALDKLKASCFETQHAISDKADDLKIFYKSSALAASELKSIAEHYKALYAKQRPREVEQRHTISGPHRDDFSITINDQDARYFSSEGQQRSSVAALRFAEWHCLNNDCEGLPLMAIDDLGISLDQQRRSNLCRQLTSLGQVFITATDEVEELASNPSSSLIKVQKGHIAN
ncbi:MAG: DNA replication/repair protein RecF [Chlamydiota bacterium]